MSITILIPIYGVELYITQCAEALFSQTYQDIDYVFCNDCTPDRSIAVLQEVVERYPNRKPRVRIISNETNKGIGYTRKRLIDEVHGEAFFFADSDDVLPANAMEVLAKRMQETDADIVEGAYREYHDGKLGEPCLPSHDDADSYFSKALCQNIIQLRVWGKLFKASVIARVPTLFLEGIDYAEDVCATSRLVAVASRAWTDEVVYWYRTDNTASYTKNISQKNILSYFSAMREVLRFYHMRGHLPLSVEIGMLNCYRECRKSGVPLSEADDILQYYPEHLSAKLLYSLLHSNAVPLPISDLLYRIVRGVAVL